ncbi:MAG: hypothetical protein AAF193_03740 [Bacteroidota bacterium]
MDALIPMVERTRWINGEMNQQGSGIGDISALIRYVPLASTSDSGPFNHRLAIAIGAKAPTGETQQHSSGIYLDHDLQPGSGSWDALINFDYTAKYKNVGVQVFSITSINTVNLSAYRYGNTVSSLGQIFYQFKWNSFSISPMMGIYHEFLAKDVHDGEVLDHSGGQVLYGSVGMDIRYKNVSIQGMWQDPFDQQLHGVQIPIKNRYQIGIVYSLKTKR